ncbi:la protein 1-like [Iris pallida]|uniref:La protein 1-like n=1 Tax=Iris pallida TaxID=29817 RepID=A0AAX6HW72_IRIPA|nr:la protein 1-like [Iris pallida]
MAASLDEAQVKNILRQVEFYFSDSNLPRDNFLKKTVQESDDGLVSLGLICSFTRMRNHLGLGNVKAEEIPEETVAAVSEALRKSTLLKVSEDGKRIGRSTELPEPEVVIEQVDSRTIAASPFPSDVKIEDIEAFFGQHAKVNSVRLPRIVGDKRCFCGTALIEFSEEESVKMVLTKSLIYADAELELKPKKDFDDEREKQREEFEKTRPDKNNSNGSYPKGLIVSFKLKSIEQVSEANENGKDKKIIHDAEKENGEMVAEDQTVDAEKEKSAEDVREEKNEMTAADDSNVVEHNNSSEDAKNESDESANQAKDIAEKAAGNEKNILRREDLKVVFQKFGTVKFIDFSMGEESGYIRFENPDAAVKARAAAVLTDEGGLVVKNSIVTLEPLSGDAEKEYWSLLRGGQEKSRDSRGNYRGRGRSNRGRQFDGKRHRQGGYAGDGRRNKTHKSSTEN